MATVTKYRPVEVTATDPVFAGLRKLVLLGAGLALAYAGLSHASQSFCSGPRDLVTGANGVCVEAVMTPSPLVFIALAVVIYSGISRLAKGGHGVPAALAILQRRFWVMFIVVVASLVIGHVWFWTVPASIDFSQSHAVLYPVPFVVIDITTN